MEVKKIDYFAGLAMQAILSQRPPMQDEAMHAEVATLCYRYATAMIRASHDYLMTSEVGIHYPGQVVKE